jgi:hypothetical protein
LRLHQEVRGRETRVEWTDTESHRAEAAQAGDAASKARFAVCVGFTLEFLLRLFDQTWGEEREERWKAVGLLLEEDDELRRAVAYSINALHRRAYRFQEPLKVGVGHVRR